MTTTDIVATVMPNRKGLVAAISDTNRILGSSSTLAEELGHSLSRLSSSWAAHIAETEASEGLLSDLVARAPRLCAAVGQLRSDHPVLAEELRLLRLKLIEERALTPATRAAMSDLLDRIQQHDQAGADLIWDAYNQDIGGG